MTIIVAGHTGLVGSAIFDALDGSNSGVIGINSKVVDLSYDRFISIAGQKPLIKLAKKSISNFKLREGQPVGCMYTLRSSKMFDFLTKILHLALPRIRDFRGLPRNSFDGFGNYAFGLKADNIFPELTFEDTDKQRGMNIVVVTSAKSDESALDLLESLGFPFRKN